MRNHEYFIGVVVDRFSKSIPISSRSPCSPVPQTVPSWRYSNQDRLLWRQTAEHDLSRAGILSIDIDALQERTGSYKSSILVCPFPVICSSRRSRRSTATTRALQYPRMALATCLVHNLAYWQTKSGTFQGVNTRPVSSVTWGARSRRLSPRREKSDDPDRLRPPEHHRVTPVRIMGGKLTKCKPSRIRHGILPSQLGRQVNLSLLPSRSIVISTLRLSHSRAASARRTRSSLTRWGSCLACRRFPFSQFGDATG
jgi:hypothetical protein